jgi:hypothetical protein
MISQSCESWLSCRFEFLEEDKSRPGHLRRRNNVQTQTKDAQPPAVLRDMQKGCLEIKGEWSGNNNFWIEMLEPAGIQWLLSGKIARSANP